MKVLKKEYQDLKDEFELRNDCCSCHVNPPCSYCIDEGNPNNLAENENAWIEQTYITFGQVHVHSINGITLDKDCVALVTGGRERAFELFGDKWAFEYLEKPDMKYFPRGIIEVD